MTEISKIWEYKKQHDEVARHLYAQLEESMQKARVKKTQVNRTVVRHFEEHLFVCHIQANVLQAQVIIFKLIPTAHFFEAIAYDPARRMYYLIKEHVFHRYKERVKTKLETPRDILYHYVHSNPFIAFKYSNPHEPAGRGVTARVDLGIIFGAKLASNILLFKTFVSHEMLSREQQLKNAKLERRYLEATRNKFFK